MQTARRVIAEALAASASRVDTDLAVLLADELTANAERHAGGALDLVVRANESSISVEVSDADPRAPILQQPDGFAEGGRGIWLVDRLAKAWGSHQVPGDGKVVWFQAEAGPGTDWDS